jgi:predicted DCC family thiol-disulfide oxidoreductase YuxK
MTSHWVILMIEVFFDGKCGLCSKEIAYYQNIAPSGIFAWMDIATDPSPLAAHQITQADALRHLHVRDAAGDWHIGACGLFGHLATASLLAVSGSPGWVAHHSPDCRDGL